MLRMEYHGNRGTEDFVADNTRIRHCNNTETLGVDLLIQSAEGPGELLCYLLIGRPTTASTQRLHVRRVSLFTSRAAGHTDAGL
jgi:hypothetical protein